MMQPDPFPVPPRGPLDTDERIRVYGLNKMFSDWTMEMADEHAEFADNIRDQVQPQDTAIFALETPLSIPAPRDIPGAEILELRDGGEAAPGSTYMRAHMVAQYVNRCRGVDLAGSVPIISIAPYRFYDRDILDNYSRLLGRDMVMDIWVEGNGLFFGSGLTPEQWLTLRYYFIPIEFTRRAEEVEAGCAHKLVIAISPLCKTVDYLDSGPPPPDLIILDDIVRVMAEYLGDLFKPDEWRYRRDGATKQAVLSRDSGIHADANMMSLAFGYSLNHAGFRFINRRQRRLCEYLNMGFTVDDRASQYWYPVLFPDMNADGDARLDSGGGEWMRLRPRTLRSLPAQTRARSLQVATGSLRGLNTKQQLQDRCRSSRANRRLFRGLLTQSRPRTFTAAMLRMEMMLRQLEARERDLGHRYP